ncbi:hypothetical protein NQ318_013243 [Aromia moschata]|uniref:Uncharacterized protein n=1 Tax=Aromia moschata TaxID=1265417 RepID=A0AAV8Y9S9_9CUCU|nr:hypothetical protein NQ318_013243 [Aromia moschata]
MTDCAATMCVVGRSLQEHGCNMIYMHALHLVAETIRHCFLEVDALIASSKKVFLKSPKHLHAFHSRCPNIPEPPQPILIRWEHGWRQLFYYAKYFEQIKAVILESLEFNPNEAGAIKDSQTKFPRHIC